MAAARSCHDKVIQGLWSSSSLYSAATSTRRIGCSTPGTQGAGPPLCKAQMAAAALHTRARYSAMPVQPSPDAAILLRLTGAPLPTTRLLRLATALAAGAGVNSTSLMGSSSESCSTRHLRSNTLQFSERQQAPSLRCMQCGCLCRRQCFCWVLSELKCPPAPWHAGQTGSTKAYNCSSPAN